MIRIRAVKAAESRAAEICAAECRMDQDTVETLILATDGSEDANESVRALIDEYITSDEHRRACRPCVDAILEAATANASVQ